MFLGRYLFSNPKVQCSRNLNKLRGVVGGVEMACCQASHLQGSSYIWHQPKPCIKNKGKSLKIYHTLASTLIHPNGFHFLTPDLTAPFFPPKILSLGLWRWCGDVFPKALLPRRQAWWKNGSGTDRAVTRHKTLVASCIMNEILLKGIVIINHYKDPYPIGSMGLVYLIYLSLLDFRGKSR